MIFKDGNTEKEVETIMALADVNNSGELDYSGLF